MPPRNSFLLPSSYLYLDAAATSLMPAYVLEAQRRYYETACANPHTEANELGATSTRLVEEARGAVAALFGAPLERYATIFLGSGSTAALNRAARIVGDGLVVTTELDHHSNLLPWQRRGPTEMAMARENGSLDISALGRLLQRHRGAVRAVAVTGASNVTGHVTPLAQVCAMAHEVGALCVVDGAQAAPHVPIHMERMGIDVLAVSGHKLYTPGSPGVLLVRRELLREEPVGDVGGGSVSDLSALGPTWQRRAEDREEAGTPNVAGILALGVTARKMRPAALYEHSVHLGRVMREGLARIPGVHVYGAGDDRLGVAVFNVRGKHYRAVSKYLDQWSIAVRDKCFCAHPFVRKLLTQTPWPLGEDDNGMVRASVGPWINEGDVHYFLGVMRRLVQGVEPPTRGSHRLTLAELAT